MNYLTNLLFIAVSCVFAATMCVSVALATTEYDYDPCCSFPCGSRGICLSESSSYTCDCAGTGYYGNNCDYPYLGTRIRDVIKPIVTAAVKNSFIGSLLNKVGFIHDFFLKQVLKGYITDPPYPELFTHFADYPTWDGYNNKTFHSRTLPPVPKNCPTSLGTAGPKILPDAETVIKEVFTRDQFVPTIEETNLLLPTFGQFFTHNALKSVREDKRKTWGTHFLNLDNVYGKDLTEQNLLRTFKSGKLKTSIINGEVFPPLIKEIPSLANRYKIPSTFVKEDGIYFALAQPFYSIFPTLSFWSTLYIREHNRLCDVLEKEHPSWDDERLYQTARLILIGINLKIIVEDYVQKISNYEFQAEYKPELIHGFPVAWGSSRISSEFLSIYYFHQAIPDAVEIDGKSHSILELINNNKVLTSVGMKTFVESLMTQLAGQVSSGRNLNPFFIQAWTDRLKHLRHERCQPFNQYRKYFGFPPYRTFEELTKNPKVAEALRKLYNNDIDAVEFFVGLMAESPTELKLFGKTMTLAIAKFAYRNVFSNTLSSPQYYRPYTFGGEVGFNIVKTTKLQDLMCRNIEGCPQVSFRVTPKKVKTTEKKNEL